jgi:putative endonuclease
MGKRCRLRVQHVGGFDGAQAVLQYFVCILASKRNGTLYTGVTSALVRRVWQHKTKAVDGFAARYGVDRLVYYEPHLEAASAILREKQIKKWRRAWKIALIEQGNPQWHDLYDEIAG